MRNSTLKPGKPLQRKTPLRTKSPSASAGLLRVAAVQAKARKPMKSSRPKMTPIRRSAQGQDCTLRIPGVCNRNPETTVWAHSNNYTDGKGAGIKARDEEGCYACHACHAFYDGGYANAGWTRDMVEAEFDAARAMSRVILREKGLIA